MKQISLALLAGVAAMALPAAAHAKMVEIGLTADAATPSCPGTPCLAMTRTTGYQAKVGTRRGLMAAPADGRIVAFTLTLAATGPKQTQFFQQRFGGAPTARLTILKPGARLYGRVLAQSGVVTLTSYLGRTVQFPLDRTLPVKKGQIVALTVPTWAPVLAANLPSDTSWRASRTSGCNSKTIPFQQTGQSVIGALAQYKCLYTTARLTYSATMITSPQPTVTKKKK